MEIVVFFLPAILDNFNYYTQSIKLHSFFVKKKFIVTQHCDNVAIKEITQR